MDKPIDEWSRRFRGMDATELENAWKSKARSDVSWVDEINFHVAAAERMKQLGNMAIDLDDDARKKLCRCANDILERLQKSLRHKPAKLQEISDLTQRSDDYYNKFGTRTARYYMYEQGLIDILGDRQAS